MPRKSFEEKPYDPISAELIREVTATGRSQPILESEPANIIPHSSKSASPSIPVHHRNPVLKEIGPESAPSNLRESTITKRFVLSRAEDADLNAFLLRMQQRAGVKIMLSVFVRALITSAMQAEEAIFSEVSRYQFRLPSTLNSLALSEFEDQWQQCLTEALRRRPRSPV